MAALGSQDKGFSPTKRTEEPGVCAQGPRPAEEMGVGATGRGRGAGQVKPQGSAPQDARSLPGLLVWSCVFRREGRGARAQCVGKDTRQGKPAPGGLERERGDRAPWGWGEPDCVSLRLCFQSVPSEPPGISDPRWLKALVTTKCPCLPGTRGPSTAVSLILQEMGTPDHLTCLLRDLCAGQETTVRTGHGTTDWFQICKGCILSPCLFNFYAEFIMRNARLEEAQAGIKIARRNVNNLRYADNTTLMAESEEELKSLLMKVKEESEKAGLKLNIQKTEIMASGPITSWQIDGETMETVTDFIFLGSKITADGD